MAVDIGTAIGYLDIDTSKFESAFKEAQKKMEDFGDEGKTVADKLETVGSSMKSVGLGFTAGLTVPIVGLGASAVKTGMEFDSSMSKVSAISGATGDDLLRLRDKAKELGSATKFSATESADAFTYMAMAGWDTEDMLNSVDGILNLAAADGLGLAETSDIVTDAMTAFGLSAKGTTTVLRDGLNVEVSNAEHFADVLAQTGRSANTNVSLLGESFKFVAPLAGTFGYKVEDTSIALGLMANAGIKGSQAGTALKTALANMSAPTKNMLGVMNEYDISLKNADGSMRTLKEVMDMLRENMKLTTDAEAEANYEREYQNALVHGSVLLSAEEVAALGAQGDSQKKYAAAVAAGSNALEEMSEKEYREFALAETGKDIKKEQLTQQEELALAYIKGVEAIGDNNAATQAGAVATLFGKEAMAGMLNIINASEEDYQKLTEQIYNADGAAKEMADTMQDNLEGRITTLKSAIEALQIAFAELIIPVLEKIVEKITGVVNWLNSLDEGTKKTIITIALVLAAIGPVLVIVGQLITSIGAIISGVTAVSGFVSGTLIPALSSVVAAIGWVPIAIAAVIAIIVVLYTKCEWFRNGVNSVLEAIGSVIKSLVDLVTNTVTKFLDNLRQKWDNDWAGIRSTVEQVAEMIKTLFQNLTNALKSLFAAFAALFRGDWEGFWNNIKSFFGTVWKTIGDLLSGWLKVLVSAFLGVGAELFSAAKESMEKVGEAFEAAWKSIMEWFEKAKEDPVGTILSISDKLADAGRAIIDALLGGLQKAWEGVTKWFTDIVDWVADKVSSIISSMGEANDAAKSVSKTAESAASGKTLSGSHRGGLDYVPYDGYQATLHTGERVLTQEEARAYGGGGKSNNFYFYGTPPLDEYETARQFKLAQRQLALQ